MAIIECLLKQLAYSHLFTVRDSQLGDYSLIENSGSGVIQELNIPLYGLLTSVRSRWLDIID